MKGLFPPLALGLAGAALLGLGGLGWVARDLVSSTTRATGGGSLLELLEEVRQGSGPSAPPTPQRRPAPQPPSARAWTSPLGASCPAAASSPHPTLRARLARLESQKRRVAIDPTNYGERFRQDAYGNPLDPTPRLVVLHETVYSMGSAINTFVTPHPRDEDQVSYHMLIGLDGTIVETLDPSHRAFGAGNSAFNGNWAITNPRVGGSVNNFALHLSLETPADGEHPGGYHSGYTAAQYDALALVLADWTGRFEIPLQNITTHQYVDLGGERADPRSFDWNELASRLSELGIC